jgi:hypothetical protein
MASFDPMRELLHKARVTVVAQEVEGTILITQANAKSSIRETVQCSAVIDSLPNGTAGIVNKTPVDLILSRLRYW